jgi:hypothetical protein
MRRISICSSVFAFMLLATLAGTPARAQTFDRLTFLTFSGQVQIPGATLDAGTYRFHLANADGGRNVMQVMSNDGVIVHSMFFTIPETRSTVTDEATVTFREAPAGVAPPVHALFYGGERDGFAFLYGKGEPNLTPPPIASQPEVSFSPNASPSVTRGAPSRANAAPSDSEPSNVAPGYAAAGAEPALAPDAADAALPATASLVPVFALGGVLFLLFGLGVGVIRRLSA